MSDFSLDLDEDQLQLQKWVHDFSENVVRPAAHEWDEREETPWRSSRRRPTSACTPSTSSPTPSWTRAAAHAHRRRGARLGRRRHRPRHPGSTLGLAGIAGNGTPEQLMEWGPQCFGTPEKIQLAAFAVSEPDAGSDVSSLRTRAVYDEAKDEWVLNGTKTWITNGGIADIHVVVARSTPSSARVARPAHRPAEHAGPVAGSEVPEDGHPASHTAEVVLDDCRSPATACSVARTSSTSGSPAPRRASGAVARRP